MQRGAHKETNVLVTYNFSEADIADGDFRALFETRRRDATFAYARKESDGSVLLIRDHLGTVPLYYRTDGNAVRASLFLPDLWKETDTLSEEGLRTFLGTGTAKVSSLFAEVQIVPPGTAMRVHEDGTTAILYQYRVEPRELPGWSFADCLTEADRLLLQAAKRTLKEKTVGLYLSGGIDSALTGIYVKRAGGTVHAYTGTPWGDESEEARLAKRNGETIGVAKHTLRPLDTKQYGTYSEKAVARYRNLCGATSKMAIVCLLEETEVSKERQVYFAQNCDTMNTSVPDQSLLFFARIVPRPFRRFFHRLLGRSSIIDEFVSFRTTGLVKHYPPLVPYEQGYSILQKLAIAGMYFGHTPVDGDIVILPSIAGNQIVSNLFYDMDVVEFALGIPLIHRIEWSRESKIGIALGKRVFRELARRYLPSEIVDRKKGLTVPVKRDLASKTFFDALPRGFGNLELTLPSHRFAAATLARHASFPRAPHALIKGVHTIATSTIRASVAILTYNSGKTLGRALESVRAFDDIIVCDGGSTDETRNIAEKFGARIIAQDPTFRNANGTIADFSGIRNQTLAEAKYDWYLFIDSDEHLSPEAVREIRAIVTADEAPCAYLLPRITVVKGAVITCATAYPNYQMRFFNKKAVEGFLKPVHERIRLKENIVTKKLMHPEYVPLDMDETEMKRKQLYYLSLEASRYEGAGLLAWIKGPAFGSLKSSFSYLLRHLRILLFCRGTFMPLWIENMHHWYNWKLFTMTLGAALSKKASK